MRRKMDKSIARKELSREVANDKETIINEIIYFEFDSGVLEAIDMIFDDWEYAQEHGVFTNDDGVTLINVDDCIQEMEEKIKMNDDDDTFNEKLVRDYLMKFKGFSIWV
jgi:hypothetical protein